MLMSMLHQILHRRQHETRQVPRKPPRHRTMTGIVWLPVCQRRHVPLSSGLAALAPTRTGPGPHTALFVGVHVLTKVPSHPTPRNPCHRIFGQLEVSHLAVDLHLSPARRMVAARRATNPCMRAVVVVRLPLHSYTINLTITSARLPMMLPPHPVALDRNCVRFGIVSVMLTGCG